MSKGGVDVISFLDMHGQVCSGILHTLELLDVDVRESSQDTVTVIFSQGYL